MNREKIHASRWLAALTLLLMILGGLTPVLAYWFSLGQIPTVLPSQAIQALNQPGSAAVLVDVRAPEDFARRHINGAENWPMKQIQDWKTASQAPGALQGKALYLICDNGWQSAQAAFYLRAVGFSQVSNVRGGMQEWAKAAWKTPDLQYTAFTGPDSRQPIPAQTLPPSEQQAQLLAGFVIKPLYTFASLALALLLFKEKAHDMLALRWGLLAFFLGELFCYVNFLVFQDDSYFSEYLHSYGMVVGFAFILYALQEGFEARLLHFNDMDKRCGALGVCLLCSRYRNIVCRARRLYQLVIPMLVVLCTIPLFARFNFDGYTGLVFGYPYFYARFGVYQFYENRLLPAMAIACFVLAYLPLWSKHGVPVPRLTLVLLSAGLGALVFALLRLSLGSMYATNMVWFSFWEELTELIFILAITAGLWIFRVALFPRGFGSWITSMVRALRA